MASESAALSRWLKDHALSVADLSPYGIVAYSDKLVVPVHTPFGRYAFDMVRVFDKEYKFVMEPASSHQSMVLWNYHRAIKSITALGWVVVVEGFADVIALNKHEVFNAVALVGSRVSHTQASLASMHAKSVVCWLDGDEAGADAVASLERVGFWKPFTGVSIKGLDPCECVRDKIDVKRVLSIVLKRLPVASLLVFSETADSFVETRRVV